MIRISLLVVFAFLLQACSSLAYYWEKIEGHSEIIDKQRPIQEVIDDPKTTHETKLRLINANEARQFASEVLKLPENDSYKNYADIGRDYVVWTVVATPAYSIKPKEWCFIIIGCLSYRGYFSKQSAEDFAAELRKKNMDVYVAGTKAYSTLGWFDDPLLNTMLYKSEAYRIGIIFHELAHQQMYADSDTAFNEAFATTVELQGIKHWFTLVDKQQLYADYVVAKKRDEDFKNVLKQAQVKLKNVYASEQSNSILERNKKMAFKELKNAYQKFKKRWEGYNGYDKWMSQPLNNAHLALVATYNNWVPALTKLFEQSSHDYTLFYKKIEQLRDLGKQQREVKLNQLMGSK